MEQQEANLFVTLKTLLTYAVSSEYMNWCLIEELLFQS